MAEHSWGLRLVRLLAFAATLAVWYQVTYWRFDLAQGTAVLVGGVLVLWPIVWAGRRTLDADPTPDRAAWVTTFVHFAIMIALGSAIIVAVRGGLRWPGPALPLPPELGVLLIVPSALVVTLTMLNLAVQGLGAPFAIVLTQRLAVGWLYAYTRNPMVLSAIICLVGIGTWFRSVLFVLWVLVLVLPTMVAFLKVYEERELEVRFGASYLDYKARTPMLWPRWPGR